MKIVLLMACVIKNNEKGPTLLCRPLFYKETNMAFFPAVLTLLVVYDIIETEKIKQGFV